MTPVKRAIGIILVAFGIFWTYIALFRNIALTFDEILAKPEALIGTIFMPIIVLIAGIYLLKRK